MASGGLDRRAFIVDGTPLRHWDKTNFEPERDETCRVIYKPKHGAKFFQQTLRPEDYLVMRRSTMEQPFFSKYNRFYPKRGHFCCKACGNPLYSHHTKLKREDGWPAFGACVDGAVGMTTAEERKEMQNREREAAIRLQAFVRGCMERARICEKVDMLIEKVMELKRIAEEEKQERADTGDAKKKKKKKKENSIHLIQSLSLHSLDNLTFSSDDLNTSSSSFASFGDDDDERYMKPVNPKKKEQKIKPQTNIAASAASAGLKRSQYIETNAMSEAASEFNDLAVEIHCHRCKSFLGCVYEEANRGQDGVTSYKERHQVNGRALKYVEDDLPKRTSADFSLLFARSSQARLLGLKATEPEKEEPEFLRARPKNGVFVSPRTKKKKAALGSKPGVGVTFQSPLRSPRKRLTSNQKRLENFFLNQSVH